MPDMDEITMTLPEWPAEPSDAAWRRGRKATLPSSSSTMACQLVVVTGRLMGWEEEAHVVKYTAVTSVLKTSPHCEKSSLSQSVALSSLASVASGSALGPDMPALVTCSPWVSFEVKKRIRSKGE